MTINTATLKSKLQTQLDNYLYSSSTPSEVLSLALSVNIQDEPNIVTVANADILPNLEVYDSPSAIVCFITNINVFVISSNKKWLTFDGRLVRDDTGVPVAPAYIWGSIAGTYAGFGFGCLSSPASLIGGINNWISISQGQGASHHFGIRSNGTLWGWGLGSYGRLGDGTINNRSSPVSVIGGFTDWCQASAGSRHAVGLRVNGTAWAWGCNNYGQLGDGTTTSRLSPVSVIGGFTDWCQIAAGSFHSVAIRQNGTAWSWGRNNNGQFGDGTCTNRSSPVSVVGGFTDWCKISAGAYHVLAQRTNCTLWAWGRNGIANIVLGGALGDGSAANRASPVSVVGGFTWCQASAGSSHSLAIRTNGTLWAWGLNYQGRLGDGTTISRLSPVSVVGGFTDWCQVSAGSAHNLAIRTNGTLWAWGCNERGELGDGTVVSRCSPVSVLSSFTNWSQISASFYRSVATTSI
jgi:alpha-tubulin suppressor-like RCC1 family protein